MGGRFAPGDYVTIAGGLPGFEDIVGTSNAGNSIGSLLFGDRTGIIIGTTYNGYNVDFGKSTIECVSVPESLLVRA